MSTVARAVDTHGDLLTPSVEPWQATRPNEAARDLFPYEVTFGDATYSQRVFLDDDRRFHNFTSGVGAGKTLAGILRVALNVEKWNPGEMGMIVTPTTLGLKNVIIPELSKWGFLDDWVYKGPTSDEPGLHAPNGARILLESADNDRKIERLRGPSISWVWIDEAAIVPENAWQILLGRLRTGNYRNAFITTTPSGYNWVYESFVDAETRVKSVNNVLGVPSYANPWLPIDYRRDILDEYEGNFHAQEVLGEFVSFEGLVYPWFDDEDHVVALEDVPEPGSGSIRQTIYGVDWGHNNPATISAWVYDTDEDWWLCVAEWYERRCTPQDQARELASMIDRWGPGPVYCDPSEPANIETFHRENVPAQPADNAVTPGIQHVAGMGANGELAVAEYCQNLRNEFNAYQYKDSGRGDAPLKQNDHLCDSMRYALYTHSRLPRTETRHTSSGRPSRGERVTRYRT